MASNSRFTSCPALVAALLAALPVTVAAQVRCEPDPVAGTAVLEGAVLDTETAFPLQGAAVTVRWTASDGRGRERQRDSDRTGEFRFCDVPAGISLSVQARWYGERSIERPVTVEGGRARLVLEVESPHVPISGQVLEEGTESPLAAASVRIGPGPERLTDERGKFRFENVPPGLHAIRVERIGFIPVEDSVGVDFGAQLDLNIRLSTRAVPLEAIEVVVRSQVLESTGFYARQQRGIGTFISRAELDRRALVNSSDILRMVPGVRLVRDRFGGWLALGRGNCPFRFFIDGVPINRGFSIDEMPPHWLEGLEIYHLSQVPGRFAASPSQPDAECGVIVVWTRNRR